MLSASGASTSKDNGSDSKAKKPQTENNCICSGKCQTNRCCCVKEKRGCDPSCKCKTKCKNVFSHLEYFFGADTTCDLSPCFEQWLLKNAKNGVETIDRNALRDQIKNSTNKSSDFYYSFCYNDLLEDDSYWHCAFCQTCDKWRTWHCNKCNKCTYGQSLPCERCGRSSADSSGSD